MNNRLLIALLVVVWSIVVGVCIYKGFYAPKKYRIPDGLDGSKTLNTFLSATDVYYISIDAGNTSYVLSSESGKRNGKVHSYYDAVKGVEYWVSDDHYRYKTYDRVLPSENIYLVDERDYEDDCLDVYWDYTHIGYFCTVIADSVSGVWQFERLD